MMVKSEESSRLEDNNISVERVQIGVRMEKRMVKVLKALAEYHDVSLGDLLEGIVLHAFENVTPFSEETLQRIAQLKQVYGMDYGVSASHRFSEQVPG
jgi:predicted DNA-binding ribbon-helix-helix protein